VKKHRVVGSGRFFFPGVTRGAERLAPFLGSFFVVLEGQKSQQCFFSNFMKNIYIYG
jgi:hypothetical protein